MTDQELRYELQCRQELYDRTTRYLASQGVKRWNGKPTKKTLRSAAVRRTVATVEALARLQPTT